MQTVELFSGTKSFSKVMDWHGHQTFTVDLRDDLNRSLVADIRTLSKVDFPNRPNVLWCSPPCEGFSVASIGHHWNADKTPKTETAKNGIDLIRHTLRLVDDLKPDWFFIENPRGMLRKQGLWDHPKRHTVTYCQYGDVRMKPTDIWTNADWWQPKPMCRNGAPCHVSAPRGSKKGTQGLNGAKERGVMPPALFKEMLVQLSMHNGKVCGAVPSQVAGRIQLGDRVPSLVPNLHLYRSQQPSQGNKL